MWVAPTPLGVFFLNFVFFAKKWRKIPFFAKNAAILGEKNGKNTKFQKFLYTKVLFIGELHFFKFWVQYGHF